MLKEQAGIQYEEKKGGDDKGWPWLYPYGLQKNTPYLLHLLPSSDKAPGDYGVASKMYGKHVFEETDAEGRNIMALCNHSNYEACSFCDYLTKVQKVQYAGLAPDVVENIEKVKYWSAGLNTPMEAPKCKGTKTLLVPAVLKAVGKQAGKWTEYYPSNDIQTPVLLDLRIYKKSTRQLMDDMATFAESLANLGEQGSMWLSLTKEGWSYKLSVSKDKSEVENWEQLQEDMPDISQFGSKIVKTDEELLQMLEAREPYQVVKEATGLEFTVREKS